VIVIRNLEPATFNLEPVTFCSDDAPAQLLAFTLALGALLVLSRWINRQVQIIGLRVTGSSTITIMLYYLVMFPGILLHELSHYVTAVILGMKVGKFSLGPKVRRNAIELGRSRSAAAARCAIAW